MLRRVTWRFWTVVLGLVFLYMLAGYWLHTQGRVEYDIYTYGWVAEIVAQVAFIGGITIYSRRRTTKWWLNDVGTNLVLVQLASLPMAVVFAWTFLFRHGLLGTGALGWAAIGTPWWTAGMIAWRNWIYSRVSRESDGDHE